MVTSPYKNAQTLTCSTSDLSELSMSLDFNKLSGCLPLKYGQWPDSIRERNIADGPLPNQVYNTASYDDSKDSR